MSTATSKKQSVPKTFAEMTEKEHLKYAQKMAKLSKQLPHALIDVSSTPEAWETFHPKLWSLLNGHFQDWDSEGLSQLCYYIVGLYETVKHCGLPDDVSDSFSEGNRHNGVVQYDNPELPFQLIAFIREYINNVANEYYDAQETADNDE